jgi:hypothetical protein
MDETQQNRITDLIAGHLRDATERARAAGVTDDEIGETLAESRRRLAALTDDQDDAGA